MSSWSRSTSPLTAVPDLFLGDAAHLEQPRFQLLELVLKMAYDSFDRLHLDLGI